MAWLVDDLGDSAVEYDASDKRTADLEMGRGGLIPMLTDEDVVGVGSISCFSAAFSFGGRNV